MRLLHSILILLMFSGNLYSQPMRPPSDFPQPTASQQQSDALSDYAMQQIISSLSEQSRTIAEIDFDKIKGISVDRRAQLKQFQASITYNLDALVSKATSHQKVDSEVECYNYPHTISATEYLLNYKSNLKLIKSLFGGAGSDSIGSSPSSVEGGSVNLAYHSSAKIYNAITSEIYKALMHNLNSADLEHWDQTKFIITFGNSENFRQYIDKRCSDIANLSEVNTGQLHNVAQDLSNTGVIEDLFLMITGKNPIGPLAKAETQVSDMAYISSKYLTSGYALGLEVIKHNQLFYSPTVAEITNAEWASGVSNIPKLTVPDLENISSADASSIDISIAGYENIKQQEEPKVTEISFEQKYGTDSIQKLIPELNGQKNANYFAPYITLLSTTETIVGDYAERTAKRSTEAQNLAYPIASDAKSCSAGITFGLAAASFISTAGIGSAAMAAIISIGVADEAKAISNELDNKVPVGQIVQTHASSVGLYIWMAATKTPAVSKLLSKAPLLRLGISSYFVLDLGNSLVNIAKQQIDINKAVSLGEMNDAEAKIRELDLLRSALTTATFFAHTLKGLPQEAHGAGIEFREQKIIPTVKKYIDIVSRSEEQRLLVMQTSDGKQIVMGDKLKQIVDQYKLNFSDTLTPTTGGNDQRITKDQLETFLARKAFARDEGYPGREKLTEMLKAGALKGKKILVVDDDKRYTNIFSTQFSKYTNGATVEVANSVAEAEQKIADTKFDLIYTDLQLDKTTNDGVKVLNFARSKYKNIPVVAFTGDDIGIELWDKGFTGALDKSRFDMGKMALASVAYLDAKNKFYEATPSVDATDQKAPFDQELFSAIEARSEGAAGKFEAMIANGVLKGKKILIIDDNRDISDAFLSIEQRTGGATIDVASSVLEAKQRIASTKYDLVYVDMQLDKSTTDGIEILKLIRIKDKIVPVIEMTTNAKTGVMYIDRWDQGFSGCLNKIDMTRNGLLYSMVVYLDAKNKFYQTPTDTLPSTTPIVSYYSDLFLAKAAVDTKTSDTKLISDRMHLESKLEHGALKGKKILFVEDNKVTTGMYLSFAHYFKGATIEVAMTVAEAKQKIQETDFDIIYTDMHLNESTRDGVKILDFVMSRKVKTPVVTLTEELSELKLWNDGFSGALLKSNIKGGKDLALSTVLYLDAKNKYYYQEKPLPVETIVTTSEPAEVKATSADESLEPKEVFNTEEVFEDENAPIGSEADHFLKNLPDKPKEETSDYVEENIEAVEKYVGKKIVKTTKFSTLLNSLASKKSFIVRTEWSHELKGGSGVSESYAVIERIDSDGVTKMYTINKTEFTKPNDIGLKGIENRPEWKKLSPEEVIWVALCEYKKNGTIDQQLFESVLKKKEYDNNEMLRKYMEFSHLSYAKYMKEASYSYSEYIPGRNGMVVADSADSSLFYVSLGTTTFVVQNNKILGELYYNGISKELREETIETKPADSVIFDLVNFYRGVVNLPKLKSVYVPLVEFQLAENNNIYFLQYHLTARAEKANFELTRPLEEDEFKAVYVRGVTPPAGIIVTTYLIPDKHLLTATKKQSLGISFSDGSIPDNLDDFQAFKETIIRKMAVAFLSPSDLKDIGWGHKNRTPFLKSKMSVVVDFPANVQTYINSILGVERTSQYNDLNKCLAASSVKPLTVNLRVISNGKTAYIKLLKEDNSSSTDAGNDPFSLLIKSYMKPQK